MAPPKKTTAVIKSQWGWPLKPLKTKKAAPAAVRAMAPELTKSLQKMEVASAVKAMECPK